MKYYPHKKLQYCKIFQTQFLKLFNNLSRLNKGNHDSDGVSISGLNSHRFLRFFFSVFSLVLISIEKIYQTHKPVIDHISKQYLEYFPTRCIFNSLLGVWKCDKTWSFVFDTLLTALNDLSIKVISG